MYSLFTLFFTKYRRISRKKVFPFVFSHVCLDIIFPEFEFIKPELYHIPLKRYPIYLLSQSPQHILRNFLRVSPKPRNFWKPILLFQLLCLYRMKIRFRVLTFQREHIFTLTDWHTSDFIYFTQFHLGLGRKTSIGIVLLQSLNTYF